MFKNFLIILALLMSVSLFAANREHCLVKKITYGNDCNSSDSMMVEFKNSCNEKVYLKYCLLKKNGKWSCGSTNLKINENFNGAWTCHSKNWKYKFTACTNRKGCKKLK